MKRFLAKNYQIIIFLVLFFGAGILWGLRGYYDLKKNGYYTVGEIIKIGEDGKGNKTVYYKYQVLEMSYEGKRAYSIKHPVKVGNALLVVYSSKNRDLSTILFNKPYDKIKFEEMLNSRADISPNDFWVDY